ncbi:(2Fe-2S)-binding protein [Ciceribacter lividus]|nr:(2Fe-2S)-binding protein [Ciceribacter lividus]
MFRNLLKQDHAITLSVNGKSVAACTDDTVATALLKNGITSFRMTSVSGAARGPYCCMGVCFECLVTIDGETNRQACLVPVTPGMAIETHTDGSQSSKDHGHDR